MAGKIGSFKRTYASPEKAKVTIVYCSVGSEPPRVYAVCASIPAAAKAEQRYYAENKEGICWADEPREVEGCE